jgi:hypothetical protein
MAGFIFLVTYHMETNLEVGIALKFRVALDYPLRSGNAFFDYEACASVMASFPGRSHSLIRPTHVLLDIFLHLPMVSFLQTGLTAVCFGKDSRAVGSVR